MAAPRDGKKGADKLSEDTGSRKKEARGDQAADVAIDPADAPLELSDETPAAAPVAAAAAAAPAEATLDLHGVEERLPWLESDDDFDKDDGDGGRIAGFMLGGLLALALIVGGIWWVAHRGRSQEVADGGVIAAPPGPYKEAPANPGGKTFAGTGDSSFAMSEGKNPAVRLGEDKTAPKPAESPAPKPAASQAAKPAAAAATPAPSGVGVQIAAFSSRATAEAGWTKLVAQHEALAGVAHRVVEGKADIGTVYRLQAVPGDLAAANALCSKLKAAGAACQVKR